MNTISYLEKIKEDSDKILDIFMNGNKNYIFGCGWMGRKLFDVLHAMNKKIDGFVVTQKVFSMIEDVPVYSYEEVRSDQISRNIFIALRDQDEKLTETLKKKFDEVISISYPYSITCIEARYYLDYFISRGIDCSSMLIELSDFTFFNPFIKDVDYLLSWVYEAGDLLLPCLFNDYQRIDEGPYEYGDVKLQADDIVIDCGANIGLFTSVALQKGCTVYGFEPMPDAIAYLEEFKKITYGNKLIICPFALSDKPGMAVFRMQNHDLLGASLLENHNNVDTEINIDVLSIDAFVKDNFISRVDFIKADIEGSERDMLNGAAETIKNYHPKLSICTYHLADDKEVLESIIHEIEPQYVIEHKWKKLFAYVP